MSKHETSYWQARALDNKLPRQIPCERCGTPDCLVYSRIANMRLCKHCWIEVAEIYDKYKAELLAWKVNR